jgi:hypothetical protein
VIAHAQTIVPWALRNTVESDGDSTPDVFDNAPGVANNQADADMDQIGDVIDPTPVGSNPNLGDPGLGWGAPSNVPAGSPAQIPYIMMLAAPPGDFGHIDLDLNSDSTYDATYFGPLTTSLNILSIPANLFIDPGWNLNLPGTYIMQGKAFGPGRSSQNFSITGVTVVPEPTMLSLLAASVICLRRRRSA